MTPPADPPLPADRHFDCLIVGAGIIGLSHALAASRHGLRVAVLDREARAIGASIRNFGFITVTGQPAGITWRRARRSRDVWAEVAAAAGIEILQRGLLMCARRPEAVTVLEEFASGAMGEGCQVLRGPALDRFRPSLRGDQLAALQSDHELRVESRDAIPRLAAWLQAAHNVTLVPRIAVRAVETGRVETTSGAFTADHIVVCPGPDLVTLFPDVIARRGVTLCKLHMLRVASPGWRLPAPVMSDLGLVRYLGYAGCPSLPALHDRLRAEQGPWLDDGIHLIAVQSADGSLVVGDSHHYDPSPDPFQPRAVDDRILAELSAVLDIPSPDVIERWTGLYPSGPDIAFHDTPMPGVRLVMVTSGTGASTGFAIGEETIADLLGHPSPPHVDA
jgi:D-hydroxyproline dehydrogenase subunit beta